MTERRRSSSPGVSVLSRSDELNDPPLDQAERRLRAYVRRVARGLGLGPESAWCEVAEEANAYVALDRQLPQRPGRDVALVWDERRGWAVGVETGSGEDLLIVAWHGPELLPAPARVVRFTEAVLAGDETRSVPPVISARQRARLATELSSFLPD